MKKLISIFLAFNFVSSAIFINSANSNVMQDPASCIDPRGRYPTWPPC